MTHPRPGHVLEHVRKLFAVQDSAQAADPELLARFAAHRDERAFESLLRRHGPMVLRLCRRVLHNWHDAEDVFQATFLVLARKAAAIRKGESLGCWLHGVAYRLAMKARARARRAANRAPGPEEEAAPDLLADLTWREVRAVLDEELNRLPVKYRAPLLLHYLEGQPQEEAARQLRCSLSTLKRRLERGRELLRGRLARRGLALAAPLLVTLLAHGIAPAAVPPALLAVTVRAAVFFAAGAEAAAGLVSADVASLAGGLLRAMFHTKLKIATALLLAVGLLGTGAVWLLRPAAAASSPEEPKEATVRDDKPPEVYALFRLAREEPRLLNDAQPGRAPSDSDFAMTRRTQAALLKSRLVLNAALRKHTAATLPLVRQQRDPVAWLEKALQVDYPNNAELIRVGMSGHEPEAMAAVVNAVVDAYLQEIVDGDRDQKMRRLNELERAYSASEEKMRRHRAVLKGLADALRTSIPGGPASAMRQQLLTQKTLDCTRELRRVRLEQAATEVRLARRRAAKKGAEVSAAAVSELEEQAAILRIQEHLLRNEEKQLQDEAERVGMVSFELQLKQTDIDQAEGVIKTLRAEVERLNVELQSPPGRITLVQRAEAPKAK